MNLQYEEIAVVRPRLMMHSATALRTFATWGQRTFGNLPRSSARGGQQFLRNMHWADLYILRLQHTSYTSTDQLLPARVIVGRHIIWINYNLLRALALLRYLAELFVARYCISTHFDLFNHLRVVPICTQKFFQLFDSPSRTQIQMPMAEGQRPQIHIHFSRPVVKQTGVA